MMMMMMIHDGDGGGNGDGDGDDDDDDDDKAYIHTGKSLPYLFFIFYIYRATSNPKTGPMISLKSFQFH